MKKLLSSMAVIAFVAGTVSSAFGQIPENKSEEAGKNLSEPKKEVVVQQEPTVKKDTSADYQKLTKESSIRFTENEKSIADLRTSINKSNSYAKDADLKRVDVLEQKNNDLKRELAGCQIEGKTEFSTYKSEFNSNLDLLAKELKDFKITI